MRRILVLAAASLATLACTSREAATGDSAAPAAASLPSPSETAAVRQAIDSANTRFQTAMLGGDTVTLTNSYTDDAVVLPANAKAAHGRAEIAKIWPGLLSAYKIPAFTLTTSDVVVAGDYAIETGAYDMTLQPKTGKEMKDTGKYIVVWKKQADGSWKMFRDIWNSDLPAAG